jgi:hypothetical protein
LTAAFTNALTHQLSGSLDPLSRGRRFEQFVIMQIKAALEYARKDLQLSFWRTHGEDKEYGGYLTYLDKDGNPTGETVKTIEMGITDDGVNGPDKTLEVGIRNAKGAVLGEMNIYTYTIMDNDPEPVVTFTVANRQVKESAGSATIGVELSGCLCKALDELILISKLFGSHGFK